MSDELFTAIHDNDLQQVSRLIEREPDVARARNQNGVSALMQAVYENKPEIVVVLRDAAGELDLHEKLPRLAISPVFIYFSGRTTRRPIRTAVTASPRCTWLVSSGSRKRRKYCWRLEPIPALCRLTASRSFTALQPHAITPW